MNNVGVFGWIRDSVRRSVLLGFSDAVEQLGSASDGSQELHPQLAAVLRDAAPAALVDADSLAASSTRPQRKRLGRSLEQLRRPDDADE